MSSTTTSGLKGKGREEFPQSQRANCAEPMLDRKPERRNSHFWFCPHIPVPSGRKTRPEHRSEERLTEWAQDTQFAPRCIILFFLWLCKRCTNSFSLSMVQSWWKFNRSYICNLRGELPVFFTQDRGEQRKKMQIQHSCFTPCFCCCCLFT